MTFLEQKIRDAHTAGRTALIPFVTAGFPALDTFWGIIEELDANGADVIEIGVPFSDPVADGPVVEDASRRALEQGVSLNWIMDGLKQRAGNFKAGIVLMGYLNPFLQYGLERFAADAAQAGVSGCIVPDLPLDESAPVRTTLKVHGIDLIALVGQNTSEERMREYAAVSEGYVYVVSVLGTTGARTGLPPQVEATLRRARKAFNLPLALGFGLQHPDQLAAIPRRMDFHRRGFLLPHFLFSPMRRKKGASPALSTGRPLTLVLFLTRRDVSPFESFLLLFPLFRLQDCPCSEHFFSTSRIVNSCV